ncbi:hypothetical protein Tco_0104833 [Tanacetum coccineum]
MFIERYCSSVKKIYTVLRVINRWSIIHGIRRQRSGTRNTHYLSSCKLVRWPEYESEFVVLANRVTGISESLLTSFYISELKLTLQIDLLRARPITLGEASALAWITKARFEDERATTFISKPNDLNIAVQVQDIEETTLHTSNKVEVVSTSMVTTYEEHGCQDGFCMVATYVEQGCQDGLKPVTSKSPTGKKG